MTTYARGIAAGLASLAILGAPAVRAADVAAAGSVPALESGVRVSHIVDAEVLDERGWIIGEVEDLLVDADDGSLRFIVLTAGGRYEANTPPLALKLPSVAITADGRQVRTTMTMEELKRLPTVSSALEDEEPALRARLVSAGALAGADLQDSAGRDLGGVRALVVDLAAAKTRFAVADYDPTWLGSGKFVALHKLQIRRVEGKPRDLALVADDATLRAAPGFESARWPELSNSTWSGRIHRWMSVN